jgi:hypothetical protein
VKERYAHVHELLQGVFLSLFWVSQLSRNLTADAGFLFDEAAVLWVAIKKALYFLTDKPNNMEILRIYIPPANSYVQM